MDTRRIVWGSLLLAGVFVALYDVDPVFDVALPGETLIPDPVVEEAYAQCYLERDEEIHATAFGTIDNPDVQKEFISSHRARAASECRERHPEVLVTVREPARFDLVDVRPRFW